MVLEWGGWGGGGSQTVRPPNSHEQSLLPPAKLEQNGSAFKNVEREEDPKTQMPQTSRNV